MKWDKQGPYPKIGLGIREKSDRKVGIQGVHIASSKEDNKEKKTKIVLQCVGGVMAYAQPGVGKNRVYGVGEGQESFQSIPERAPHLKGTCVWKLLTVISQQPTLEMSRNVLRRVDDRGKLPR